MPEKQPKQSSPETLRKKIQALRGMQVIVSIIGLLLIAYLVYQSAVDQLSLSGLFAWVPLLMLVLLTIWQGNKEIRKAREAMDQS